MAKRSRTMEADMRLADAYAATCRVSGEVAARRLSPDDCSIWLYVSELASGASLEWSTDHGDEAIYVIDMQGAVDHLPCAL